MNLKESIRLAIDNIRVNRMRSVLTMLGIIIGISAVITITTIGTSLKKTISNSLSAFGGTNSISCYMTAIYPEDDADWDTWVYPETTDKEILTWDDMRGFMDAKSDKLEDVVINNGFGSAQVTTDEGEAKVTLMGITHGYMDANNVDLLSGRDINLKDNDGEKASALVSDLFVKYACDGKNPVGRKFEVEVSGGNIINIYVAGVYKYNANTMGGYGSKVAEKDLETPLFLPYTYIREKAGSDIYGGSGIDYFTVITKEDVDTTAFTSEIKEYFAENKYNGTTASDEFTVETYDMASELKQITQILDVITVAIAIIASISLIVGGVGVMNIMLVSVVERTREIGIRKALGARKKNIKQQFLTEAVVICLIGGFIGIAIGILNGLLLSVIGGKVLSNMGEISGYITVTVSPSVTAIVISVVFSMLVGIIFGLYPAKRAAELSPIEALRYE